MSTLHEAAERVVKSLTPHEREVLAMRFATKATAERFLQRLSAPKVKLGRGQRKSRRPKHTKRKLITVPTTLVSLVSL